MHLEIYIKTHKKVHLRLYLRVHLRLHLSCACIALVGALINAQSVQNNSSNGGPDAALECTLYGQFDVALEGAP